jgi:hypothetical protein
MAPPLVPDGFDPPARLDGDGFWLEPLGPEHNDADHAAWMSSIDHIRATPGWAGSDWPHEKSLDDNRKDLEAHADDFASWKGFTYTVRSQADGDVIGCVYIYPDRDGDADAHVSSWVRVSHADLDRPLAEAVADWLARDWPFGHVRYAARG